MQKPAAYECSVRAATDTHVHRHASSRQPTHGGYAGWLRSAHTPPHTLAARGHLRGLALLCWPPPSPSAPGKTRSLLTLRRSTTAVARAMSTAASAGDGSTRRRTTTAARRHFFARRREKTRRDAATTCSAFLDRSGARHPNTRQHDRGTLTATSIGGQSATWVRWQHAALSDQLACVRCAPLRSDMPHIREHHRN